MSKDMLTLVWLREQDACETMLEWLVQTVKHASQGASQVPHTHSSLLMCGEDAYWPLRDVIIALRKHKKPACRSKWLRDRLPRVAQIEADLDGEKFDPEDLKLHDSLKFNSSVCLYSEQGKLLVTGAVFEVIVLGDDDQAVFEMDNGVLYMADRADLRDHITRVERKDENGKLVQIFPRPECPFKYDGGWHILVEYGDDEPQWLQAKGFRLAPEPETKFKVGARIQWKHGPISVIVVSRTYWDSKGRERFAGKTEEAGWDQEAPVADYELAPEPAWEPKVGEWVRSARNGNVGVVASSREPRYVGSYTLFIQWVAPCKGSWEKPETLTPYAPPVDDVRGIVEDYFDNLPDGAQVDYDAFAEAICAVGTIILKEYKP